jgi:hypothetical protein
MDTWTIGNESRRSADIGLNDDTVSRLHASLTRTDDGRWMVEDRNSTNGTTRFVNGRWVPVKRDYVLPDERLRFGRVETTVRQLLDTRRGDARGAERLERVSWFQDLAVGLSAIRDMAEFKKNLLFTCDLIASPTRTIMRCAAGRRPVNPFSFMIFGLVFYMLIPALGLSLGSLIGMWSPGLKSGGEQINLPEEFGKIIPYFAVALVINLSFNTVPFFVFKYFSMKTRYFDDFMRLMAVVTGMWFMLSSFPLLLHNEQIHAGPSVHPDPQNAQDQILEILSYFIVVLIYIYMFAFSLIAQKQFWRITYARAFWCYLLTFLVYVFAIVLIFVPAGLMYYAAHH